MTSEPNQPSPQAVLPPTPPAPPNQASADSSVDAQRLEETSAFQTSAHARADEAVQTKPMLSAAAGVDDPLPRQFGRYEVRRLLGRGSFGAVYLGHDTQLDRAVAIKAPRFDDSSHEAQQEFLREARQLARLNHPGIVSVFDVGVDGGRCFIVSEYLPGQNLHQWLKTRRPSWQEAAAISLALCEALSHAHAQRTVHRDLKPGNIILTDDLRPVLVDFGLAVSDARSIATQVGLVSGTPLYMSPEQASGKGHRIDGRTDIYAVGVILYQMLTARVPFLADDVKEVVRQILDDEPQPPRQLVRDIPRELERICLKALAKKLSDRYTTAADMADELRRVLQPASGGATEHGPSATPPAATAPVIGSPGSSTPLDAASARDTALLSGVAAPKSVEPGTEQVAAGIATAASSSSRAGQDLTPSASRQPDPASEPASAYGSRTGSGSIGTQSSVRRAREAERRRVTIVQCGCDLFDSAEIQESLDAEEQQELIIDFQNLCQQTAQGLGGAVVQTTDNGLLACFGYPVATEDATRRAVQAGLKILAEAAAYNARLRQSKHVAFAVTVAVHTDVAVTEVKADGEALSIVGQVRNVVSHLTGLAEPNSLLISDDTERLVRGFFESTSLGPQRVKGVPTPKEVFRVTAERAVRSRADVARLGQLTPLIGRDREVGLLQERWEQAAEGMGQVVLLIGEAGLGKSRLVDVLREHVTKQKSADGDPIIEWRCGQHFESSSLYPAIECFERILGFSREDLPAQRLEKLTRHFVDLRIDGDEEIGLLASLLAVPTSGRPPLALSPEQQKERTLKLLLDWLREYSRVQPALFIVEDLHWVDPTTLEFLEMLIDQGLNDSILTLLTFRPEFETPWRSKSHQTQIALNRLTKRQIGEMMAAKSGVQSIPPQVVDQVVERTDGVPLFVEEFTTMVMEAALANSPRGQLDLSTNFSLHETPATLQDLLMARLDRLASNLDVVQLGATIGREFSYELLRAVVEFDEPTLQAELAKLTHAGLLFERGRAPRVSYQFKHALIQDAAYQSLVKRKRQAFHQRIAETLESQFAESVAGQPEVLAHHFGEAGVATKAVEYWDQAGQRSLRMSAHPEAIRQLTHGLDLLKTLPESPERIDREIRMQIRLGVPLQSTRGYSAPEVQATYARANELCQQLGQTAHLFPVLYGLFRYYMLSANYTKARELGEQLRALADQSPTPAFVVASRRALGAPMVYMGDSLHARPHLEAVLAIAPTAELRAETYQYDVVDPWITSQSYMSWATWLLGYPNDACGYSRQAIAAAEQSQHPFSLALALSFAEWLHQFRRDVEETRRTAQRALQISTEHGFAFWAGWGEVLLGWCDGQQGRGESAIATIEQGMAKWAAQGQKLGRSYFLALLAETRTLAGKLDAALKNLAEAEAFCDATGEGYYRPEIHRLRGELILRRDQDAVSAATQFELARHQARAQQSRSLELRAAISLARLRHSQGRLADAQNLLAETVHWFKDGTDTPDLKHAKALLDTGRPAS